MNPLMNPVGSNAEGKLNCINAVVITQKRFTVDFLTKVMKKNEGEVPSYYVEDSHPASCLELDCKNSLEKDQRKYRWLSNGFQQLTIRLFLQIQPLYRAIKPFICNI